MKRALFPFLLAAIALVLGWNSASAEAAIELRPTQINVQADCGDTVRRTIQLRLSDDIGALQAQPMELVFDKLSRTIPVQHITVTPPAIDSVSSTRTVSFMLQISLAGVSAGEYVGDLPFTYKGGELKLPIKLSVRHRWPLPLLVLLVGVAAGIGLSIYRAKGRPRDQVLVRVGLVRAFLGRDRTMSQGIQPVYQPSGQQPGPALLNPFKTRIEAALMDVEMSLQSERWDESRAKMDQAEALLRKWIQGRLGWIQQLAYLARLQEHVQSRPGNSRYLTLARTGISDLIANAPMKDSPQGLRDEAQQLADRIEDYERAESKLDILDKLRTELPQALEQPWVARAAELRSRLENLKPEGMAPSDLGAEIDKAIQELTAQLQQAAAERAAERAAGMPGAGDGSILRSAAVGSPLSEALEPTPEAHLAWLPVSQVRGAGSRLRWFVFCTYGIALLMLAGTGFNEVYAKKATFGAELWADYLTLLIWGFGAEATRDSVTSTLRGWGVSVAGRPPEAGL